jgi:chromosome segregation ATPase
MTMSSMLRVAVQLLVVFIPVIEAENPKDTSAVGKVMEMLHEIQVKSEDELFKETLTFTEFDNWCNNTKEEREASIKANEGTEEALTAEINTKSANIEDLTTKIAGLEDDITEDKAKITNLTADRKVAKASYSVEVKDLSTAITALKKGIDGLEAAKKPSFLQLRSRTAKKPSLALTDFLGLKGGAASTLIEKAMQPEDSHLKGYDFDMSDGLSDTLW